MLCQSCECVYVNGVKCHEHGCPDAWKDYTRQCLWCGQEFKPETEHQEFCEFSCQEAFSS